MILCCTQICGCILQISGGLGRAPPRSRRRHPASGTAAQESAGHDGVRTGDLLAVGGGVRVPH